MVAVVVADVAVAVVVVAVVVAVVVVVVAVVVAAVAVLMVMAMDSARARHGLMISKLLREQAVLFAQACLGALYRPDGRAQSRLLSCAEASGEEP